MFGIGTTEFLVIIVVAVLVLGPEHLPRIIRTVSKVMSDFRRVSTEFQRTINLEAHQEEWQRQQDELAAKKRRKKKRKTAVEEDAPSGTPRDDTPVAASSVADAPADELSAEQAVAPEKAVASPPAEKAAVALARSPVLPEQQAGQGAETADGKETERSAASGLSGQGELL